MGIIGNCLLQKNYCSFTILIRAYLSSSFFSPQESKSTIALFSTPLPSIERILPSPKRSCSIRIPSLKSCGESAIKLDFGAAACCCKPPLCLMEAPGRREPLCLRELLCLKELLWLKEPPCLKGEPARRVAPCNAPEPYSSL